MIYTAWAAVLIFAVLCALRLVYLLSGSGPRRLLALHGDKTADGNFHIGAVTYHYDGDTVEAVLSCGRKVRVRLAYIDTPEKGQPYAEQAGRMLQRLLPVGRNVLFVHNGYDRYGRLLAEVYTVRHQDSVNLLLVRNGLAWLLKGFCRDRRYYRALDAAQAEGLRIWSKKNAVEPFFWRKMQTVRRRRHTLLRR